jgi:hypothetical protein
MRERPQRKVPYAVQLTSLQVVAITLQENSERTTVKRFTCLLIACNRPEAGDEENLHDAKSPPLRTLTFMLTRAHTAAWTLSPERAGQARQVATALEHLSICLIKQGVSGVGEPRDRIIAGDRG